MQVKFNKLVKCISMFQDFVDVTLVCSDGTRLDAHKVILSSVSSYFRDILKVFLTNYTWPAEFQFLIFFQTAPCKHPIIILKDTCREEASAMLEFAYTGEVRNFSLFFWQYSIINHVLKRKFQDYECVIIQTLFLGKCWPGAAPQSTPHSKMF